MAVQDILKQVKCGLPWKIIGTTKTPYHLQEVGSRVNMYAKININTDGTVYLYASCNFNNKKLGQLRPRANMCPAGWGSTPSQSRTTELVEVSLYWPTP